MFIVDCLRLFSTFVGVVVILMWIAGALGMADFALTFRVTP